MIVYEIVSLLCCLALALEVLGYLVGFIVKDREGRIRLVRGFRNGPCGIIYIISVPLYFIGNIYSYASVGINEVTDAFFSSIGSTLGLVAMQYDTQNIAGLMGNSSIYSFAVYACYLMVLVNVLVLALSLTSQRLFSFRSYLKIRMTLRDRLYVIGSNSECVDVVLSEGRRRALIVDNLDGSRAEELYFDGIAYYSVDRLESFIVSVARRARRSAPTTIVINTGSDAKNLKICRALSEYIAAGEEKKRKELYGAISVYVFGGRESEDEYHRVMAQSNGIIRYTNKYRMISTDFSDRYPLSGYLSSNQIDKATALLRPGVEINVIMLGFGDVNREVFLTSVQNDRFMSDSGGIPEEKSVNYYVFDRDQVHGDYELNHNCHRYVDEMYHVDPNDYLPLPPPPANEEYYSLDVSDAGFYRQLREILTAGPDDANFLIVALGNETENLNVARKLVVKSREWGVSTLKVFVRTEEDCLDCVAGNGEILCFGERSAVFNIEKIANDRLTNMAIRRSEIYDLEYAVKSEGRELDNEEIAESSRNAEYRWYAALTPLLRDSNLYACLSLRSKLNLIGFDYCEDNPDNSHIAAVTEEDYLSVYAKDDMLKLVEGQTVAGKKIVKYGIEYKNSLRKNMAELEHQRWNAFMIAHGYMPATVEEISNARRSDGRYTNGKDASRRLHGNITTFEGLEEFRRLVANRDGRSEQECDVICYDYQILDDAWWLLNDSGYKMIRLEENKS